MNFSEYIIHLNPRFKSGSSEEHAYCSDLGSLLLNLVPAVGDLNKEKVLLFQKTTGLTFVPEKEPEGNVCYLNNPEVRYDYKFTFSLFDILDYIYAALHSQCYRGKYMEFPKINFPWVTYPKNTEIFWKLVELGGELRQIHLLETPKAGQSITQYPVCGTNQIDEIRFEIYEYNPAFPGDEYPEYLGAVYINDTQYFEDVPLSAWELTISGNPPAQKWLNERKGRILNDDDISFYQKLIVALAETNRLIKEIDKFEIE